MIAINLDGIIKTYSLIPKSWGNVVGGFDTLSSSDLETYGFYDVITPSYNYNTQKLGRIKWDSENTVFTYPVQNKTFSQSLSEMKAEKISNLKNRYGTELAKTDWIIVRDQELGNTTDSDVLTARATLRADCATAETDINGKTTKAQVADYLMIDFI